MKWNRLIDGLTGIAEKTSKQEMTNGHSNEEFEPYIREV